MSTEKKLEETIRRAANLMGSGLAEQMKALISPMNVGITVGTLAVWAASHIYGVGEAFDMLALIAGVAFVGWGFWGGFRKLIDASVTAYQARSDRQLDEAALLLRDAVIELGISTLLALLLKKPLTGAASRAGRITQMNWTPKLKNIPPPTSSGASISYVSSNQLKTGAIGTTTPYGNIKILKTLSYRDQARTLWHEEVHAALSPKSGLLRQYRARFVASAYANSVFLRYLEEAVAETRALVRSSQEFGDPSLKDAIWTGMQFPLQDNMYAITERAVGLTVAADEVPLVMPDIVTQSRVAGSIIVDGQMFTVKISQRRSHATK